jgi:hypothetical protein
VKETVVTSVFAAKVVHPFTVITEMLAALTPEIKIVEAKAIALNHAIIFFIFIINKLKF